MQIIDSSILESNLQIDLRDNHPLSRDVRGLKSA